MLHLFSRRPQLSIVGTHYTLYTHTYTYIHPHTHGRILFSIFRSLSTVGAAARDLPTSHATATRRSASRRCTCHWTADVAGRSSTAKERLYQQRDARLVSSHTNFRRRDDPWKWTRRTQCSTWLPYLTRRKSTCWRREGEPQGSSRLPPLYSGRSNRRTRQRTEWSPLNISPVFWTWWIRTLRKVLVMSTRKQTAKQL